MGKHKRRSIDLLKWRDLAIHLCQAQVKVLDEARELVLELKVPETISVTLPESMRIRQESAVDIWAYANKRIHRQIVKIIDEERENVLAILNSYKKNSVACSRHTKSVARHYSNCENPDAIGEAGRQAILDWTRLNIHDLFQQYNDSNTINPLPKRHKKPPSKKRMEELFVACCVEDAIGRTCRMAAQIVVSLREHKDPEIVRKIYADWQTAAQLGHEQPFVAERAPLYREIAASALTS